MTTIPAFALYLDGQQNILRVTAANAEAEALPEQPDLTGKSYADGMAVLLDAAYGRGELKDGARIALDIGVVDYRVFDFAAVSAPVERFEEEKAIRTELSLGLLEDEVPEGAKTTVIDGKTVYISRIPYMSDGVQTGLETTYTYQWVPPFIEPAKYAVKSVCRGADGSSSVHFYENGVQIQSFLVTAEGETWSRTNYSNGETKCSTSMAPNGDYGIFVYYENGQVEHSENLTDGNYQYLGYAEDGTLLRYEYRFADGSYGENSYNSDGTLLLYEFQNADGSYGTHAFFSDGTEKEYKEYQANGDYYIINYYENGKQKLRESLQNGVYSKSEYEADGSYRYYCDGADGGREFFFSGGKMVKAVVRGTTYTDAEMLSNFAASLGLAQ